MTDHVVITNTNWDRVTVEARIGNVGPRVEDNRSLGTQELSRGDPPWDIPSEGENVYYRRDRDPDTPDREMTDWIEVACFGDGETHREAI